jgi:hypothetical protein
MLKPSESELREFLLRRMPSEQASRLEEAIVLEDTVAESLRAVEFDLIDDYAADRLSPADRADMERSVLTTAENRDTLRIALSLRREPSERAARRIPPASKRSLARSRVGLIGAAGSLLAAGIVGAMLIPRGQNPAIPSPTPPSGTPPFSSAPALLSTSDAVPPILTLVAETARGTSRLRLHWPANLGSIRLQAEVPTAASSDATYRLQLSDADGETLFTSDTSPAKSAGPFRFVDVTVPTPALGPGPRRITLRSALEPPEAQPLFTWEVTGALD